MSTAYVINGSEDGVIGVCSNKKAAIRVAMDYLSQYLDTGIYDYYASDFYLNKVRKTTYANQSKQLKKGFACLCNDWAETNVEITAFEVQSK